MAQRREFGQFKPNNSRIGQGVRLNLKIAAENERGPCGPLLFCEPENELAKGQRKPHRYLNAVLLPSLCQVNTWNSNSLSHPCSFQGDLPMGVSNVFACSYCATLVGSVLPEPLMASAMTWVAA